MNLAAIKVAGPLTNRPKGINRRCKDDLPDWLKGEAVFQKHHSKVMGEPTPHQGYYYVRENKQIPVELLKANRQIHWYKLLYNKTYDRYKTELDDQVPIDTPHLGYFSIDDPRHVDYIPQPATPLEYHDPQEQFLIGGLHHVATLEGPQAQLSPTHLVLPVIKQAAAQGIEIPVDIQPITSTSAVVIQNPTPPPPIVIQSAPMAQPGAQIQTQMVGQQLQ